MLEYRHKAGRYGRAVAVVDRSYPSSRTCSARGHLLATLSLGTRCWTCTACGTRDIDAGALSARPPVNRKPDPCGKEYPSFRRGGSQRCLTYQRSTVSVCPFQDRVNCQQPGDGATISEG
jgi:Putative transposase DNA-binding domain